MKGFITSDKSKKKSLRLWAIFLWLVIWQITSLWLEQEILLVSPLAVILRLGTLIMQKDFWMSIFFSFIRIVSGFFLAVLLGTTLAGLAHANRRMEEFLAPALLTIKSIPVASFVILALVWISSSNLSVFITFLMVLPIIYTNVLQGIKETDKNLLEMAKVFRVPIGKKVTYIYLYQVLPYFRSSCMISLGLSFKAGIAAEVIGIPAGSIGEKLYKAKIYLNTADLFAWTVVIVCTSLLFEKLFMYLINSIVYRMERY